jgi:hypothetical protein
MKQIVADPALVAYCGLYCGACRRFLQEKCPGCRENEKASWCKVRTCGMDHHYGSCADCTEFAEPNDCRIFDNFVSRLFGLIFRSNRAACIAQIRDLGVDGHAEKMSALGSQSLKR